MKIPHIKPPKIHWELYLQRKIYILLGCVVLTYVAEEFLHIRGVSTFHELSKAVFMEHIIFGIPLEDV